MLRWNLASMPDEQVARFHEEYDIFGHSREAEWTRNGQYVTAVLGLVVLLPVTVFVGVILVEAFREGTFVVLPVVGLMFLFASLGVVLQVVTILTVRSGTMRIAVDDDGLYLHSDIWFDRFVDRTEIRGVEAVEVLHPVDESRGSLATSLRFTVMNLGRRFYAMRYFTPLLSKHGLSKLDTPGVVVHVDAGPILIESDRPEELTQAVDSIRA